MPVRLIGDKDDQCQSIELQEMQLGEKDKTGRRSSVPVPGKLTTVSCDEFIVAIGQGSNPMLTKKWPELKISKEGHIIVDQNMATNIPGVYAGGDIVTGAATVIEAMGAGRLGYFRHIKGLPIIYE